jgi:uncharacterized protein YecE (DUF72 family)
MGTSSWTFPGWAGLLYEGEATESTLAREGLRAYARHPLMRTVGVDRTLYAPVEASVFRAYAEQVPDDFRFLVKAHEHVTMAHFPHHARYGTVRGQPNPRFLDVGYTVDNVVRPFVEGLGAKAGPLLFQFPPQDVAPVGGVRAFVERLHQFLSRLPKGPLYAVELRNRELLTPEYSSVLNDVGACHGFNAWQRMPPLDVQAKCVGTWEAPALVIRWLLPRGANYDQLRVRYAPFNRIVEEDPDTRTALAHLVREAIARELPSYVIVNNKAEGCAPESIVRLSREIAAGNLSPGPSPSGEG